MLIKDKRIAIVGGGPGGLTLARLLQLNGANVKVYERDVNRQVRQQGATLDLHQDSGLKALAAAGLLDAFKRNYRPGADRIRITDSHANVFYDQHGNEPEENFDYEYFRPEIDRGPLRDILIESLKPDTIVWDSQFQTMSQTGNTWKLEFQNGATAVADIVIGADGANSKIRSFITSLKSFYSGVTAVEGSVYDSKNKAPRIYELLNGGKIFAFGHSKCLIVSAKGDGGLTFYASCKTAPDWVSSSGMDFSNRNEIFTWFKKDFSEWGDVWHELFENAENLVPRPIYCMPLDQTWTALTNITVLGDAAHLMPPFAGEGVNMAMLDALELSKCLIGDQFNDLQSAIASYENQMRIRVSDAAQMSLENTHWMHSENAMAEMLKMFAQ